MIKIKAIERKVGFGKTSKTLWYRLGALAGKSRVDRQDQQNALVPRDPLAFVWNVPSVSLMCLTPLQASRMRTTAVALRPMTTATSLGCKNDNRKHMIESCFLPYAFL